MKIEWLNLNGAAVVDAEPFIDSRGTFSRFFCERELSEILGDRHIVNVNFSRTTEKGAIRGMHFQCPPMAEMKFVRCIRGSVFDVIIDIRRDSPTFLKWYGVKLTADNMKMLCVPEGFAHGFQALEDNSEMLYLHSEFYSRECESALNYADPMLAIEWPLKPTDISEKDKNHKMINNDFCGVKI
jgi:dTDP-4-dehydrorhamnose 3,5-epimerase